LVKAPRWKTERSEYDVVDPKIFGNSYLQNSFEDDILVKGGIGMWWYVEILIIVKRIEHLLVGPHHTANIGDSDIGKFSLKKKD
jgi:hypothetical protein